MRWGGTAFARRVACAWAAGRAVSLGSQVHGAGVGIVYGNGGTPVRRLADYNRVVVAHVWYHACEKLRSGNAAALF